MAQVNLGVMYRKGHGVERDYSKAANWYRKAAEQGDAEAQDVCSAVGAQASLPNFSRTGSGFLLPSSMPSTARLASLHM